MQDIENVRWSRRSLLMHCIQSNHRAKAKLAAPAVSRIAGMTSCTPLLHVDPVAQLLTDYRLVRMHGSVVASHLVGKVATFLPECCNSAICPQGRPLYHAFL